MRFARLLPLPIAILLLGAGASPASASVQIGQLLPPYNAASCGGRATVQVGVETGTNPYAVPAGGGVITAWQTRTGTLAGTAKLKVFRPTGTSGQFLSVGEEGPHEVKKETSPSFGGLRIPVQAGDLIGMVGSVLNCESEYMGTKLNYKFEVFPMGVDPAPGATASTESPATGYALEVAATVQPDADGDGYGDETQDACLGNKLAHSLPCTEPPKPPDTQAPRIILSSKTKQKPGKTVLAAATADEDVTFTATGSVSIVGGVTFSLVPTSAPGAANTKTGLSLGISKKAQKKIAKALDNGKKVRASVHVIAKDAAGNASNATQSITIARSLPKKHH